MVLIYSTLNLKFVFNKLMYLLISLLFCVNGIICIYFFLQVFGFSTFRIPSNSMAPELIAGDNVLVAKPVLVARFLMCLHLCVGSRQTFGVYPVLER